MIDLLDRAFRQYRQHFLPTFVIGFFASLIALGILHFAGYQSVTPKEAWLDLTASLMWATDGWLLRIRQDGVAYMSYASVATFGIALPLFGTKRTLRAIPSIAVTAVAMHTVYAVFSKLGSNVGAYMVGPLVFKTLPSGIYWQDQLGMAAFAIFLLTCVLAAEYARPYTGQAFAIALVLPLIVRSAALALILCGLTAALAGALFQIVPMFGGLLPLPRGAIFYAHGIVALCTPILVVPIIFFTVREISGSYTK